MRDMCKANGFPSYKTYQTRFGSWNNALHLANVDTVANFKAILIAELQQFYNEYHKIPTIRDIDKDKRYHTHSTYQVYFGTWNNALIAAGLIPNTIRHVYDGTESCSLCKSTKANTWHYLDDNLICDICNTRVWRQNNVTKHREHSLKCAHKRRGYGFIPLNDKFNGANAHHLWLSENNDLVIYIPYFIHKMYPHNHYKPATMHDINIATLDYWVNENFYNSLINSYV